MIPEKPLDFLNRELAVGDWITYPTGGTSCRMVLAKIVEIKDDKLVWDGARGKSKVTVFVHRVKEGSRGPKDPTGWSRNIDTKRKVRLDQLHRMIKIDSSEIPEDFQVV